MVMQDIGWFRSWNPRKNQLKIVVRKSDYEVCQYQ
jgi:hypothetical protein